MAMRYLIETYGAHSAVSMIADLGVRGTLGIALETATGKTYREFESGFIAWLKQEEATSSYYQKGRDYYDAGKYEQAVDELSVLLGVNPSSDTGYYLRGLAQYQLGEYQQALQDFEQAIKLKPRANTYGWQGLAHYKLREYRQAIKDFDHAIISDPRETWVYRWRATTYRKLGYYDEAQSDEAKACSLDKTYCD